jgi:succinate dehydrogenase / fumarate reductase cytochrome b subunit
MSDLAAKKKRPVWFNLSLLNLPAPGLVSIFHRISGALLFFPGLIWLLFLLETSLVSEDGFMHAKAYLSAPLAKLGLLVLLWAFLHHFCAGIRYLFIDVDEGVQLAAARRTSFAVFAVSLALFAIIGARLW